MLQLRFAAALVLCVATAFAQGIRATSGWTGTIQVVANQSGSGSSVYAGFTIVENYTHDSTASFLVTLAKDPAHPRRWTGLAQGAVSINNKNVMTMTAPGGILTCTGTLFWIGTDSLFSGQATLESDDSGLNYRLWITPNTIPAPNSGSVVCPYTGLQFPTVDPNSPFIPNLENENKLFPVDGTGTRLSGGLPYIGDSGIGGFVASPARITYNVSWDLTATNVAPPDPPEDPDCRSSGSIIGCLDQTLGETIPIAGTPYLLRYRSDRVPGYQGGAGQAASLGLGGWFLDPVQVYLPPNRTLLAGDGSSSLLAQDPAPGADGLIWVADGTGALTYAFNSEGRHLRTANSRTGIVELTIAYDAQGRITGLTGAGGGVTTIERDSEGRPTAIVAPHGQRTELQSDSNGLLSRVQGPAGEIHQLRHAPDGLLTGLTNAAGGNWTFSYGPTGRLLSDTGAGGATTNLSRRDSGQDFTVTVERPGGLTTKYESTGITGGRRTATTHPSGAVRTLDATLSNSSLAYENGMRVNVTHARTRLPAGAENSPVAISVKTPGGLEWSAQWSTQAETGESPQIDTLKVNGAAIASAYTASSRTFELTSAAGRKSSVRLNEKGSPVEIALPGGPVYLAEYNELGKPVAIREVAGDTIRTASIEWNAEGFPSGLTTPSGRRFSFSYDPSGRLLAETLPDGSVLSYTYDLLGNVVGVTPPGKGAHTLTYDADRRPLTYAVPAEDGPRVVSYEYNGAGRVVKIAHQDSWAITYAYDAAGRVSEASSGAQKLTYGYNSQTGQLEHLAGPAGASLSYTWDGGLPLSEQWSGEVEGKVEWRYNNDFLPVARKVNGGDEIALVYDADGFITGAGAYALTRDQESGRAGAFVLGGLQGWWAYDAAGNYNASAVSALGNEVYSAHYDRDDASRIVRKEEFLNGGWVTWEYEYDLRGRITAAKRNGEHYAAYSWDENDNRTSEQRGEGIVTAGFDAGDRLVSGGDPGAPKLTVDPWGNLLSAELPNSRIDYAVDGLGRRIGRKVDGILRQAWIYNDSIRPAAELDAQGKLVSEFLYAGAAGPPVAMKRDGTHFLLVADQVGSIRLVIDSGTGQTVQRIDYDPFGRVLHDSNPGFQPFGFAGGIHDPATGLVRMGARDYDPSLGRWISEDPRPFTGGSNHYAYCGGDPVNLWDPLGTDPSSRAGQVVQTADSKAIGDAVGKVQKTIDTAGKVVEFAKDPKAVLEAEAVKSATPEGAKSEFERMVEEAARRAEENATNLRKRLEELYEKARKALCGDDGTPPPDPNQSKGPTPKPIKFIPNTPPFVHPIYGPASGARR